MAYDCGLLLISDKLLWGTVACHFGLLGFPGGKPVARNYRPLPTNSGPLYGIEACYFGLLWPSKYLESQVAQNNKLLYPKVAHTRAKVVHK